MPGSGRTPSSTRAFLLVTDSLASWACEARAPKGQKKHYPRTAVALAHHQELGEGDAALASPPHPARAEPAVAKCGGGGEESGGEQKTERFESFGRDCKSQGHQEGESLETELSPALGLQRWPGQNSFFFAAPACLIPSSSFLKPGG